MSTTAKPVARGTNTLRPYVWGVAALVLLIPAVAMRFTAEVQWDETDFLTMGAMLAIACGTYELGARLSDNTAYRAAFGIAIVTGFLTVWSNLAVGMIGSEHDPLNLMFFGVLVVGAIGAAIAFFRPRGMAIALAVTAAAQAVAVVVGFVVGDDPRGATISAFFIVPWILSAHLFRIAARQSTSA